MSGINGKRCVGQQETLEGVVDQPSWQNSGVAPSAITTQLLTSATSGIKIEVF